MFVRIQDGLRRRLPQAAAVAFATALTGTGAQAGVTVAGAGDSYLTLGMAMQSSYTSAENGAPDGRSRSKDFSLDSVRLLTSGQITKQIGGMINFERGADDTMRTLDAIAIFTLADGVNLWMGRLLTPSDRPNLAGTYFANAWGYPAVASRTPFAFGGRDDGAVLWGNVAGGKLLYVVGAFQGKNRAAGLSNASDELLYAARLAYSFLDAETGYYGTSSYFGEKDIFTVGLSFQSQKDAVGTALNRGDYRQVAVDALFERKLAGQGVLTLEGAYYDYDTDGVADVLPTDALCSSVNNCGGAVQGDAVLATAAYLIPTQVGIGRFQPYVRYQRFDPDAAARTRQWDLGVTYVMAGHNARVSAAYSSSETGNAGSTDRFIFGVQLIY